MACSQDGQACAQRGACNVQPSATSSAIKKLARLMRFSFAAIVRRAQSGG